MTKTDLYKQYFEQSHLFDNNPDLLFDTLKDCILYNHIELFNKWFSDKMVNYHNINLSTPSDEVYLETLLIVASYIDNITIVKFLIEKGSKVYDIDKYGNTPLHFACRFGDLKLIEYLVNQGANVFQKNDDYRTPLDYAELFSNTKVVTYLTDIMMKLF